MAIHYWLNTKAETTNIYNQLIKKFFPELKMLNIQLAFRDKEKKDSEGQIIIAEAYKISTRERDLYGPDCGILMDYEIWDKSNKMEKFRVAFHELCHFSIDRDDNGEVKMDDNNRIKVNIEKHDIIINTFKKEVEIFGFTGTDQDVATFMSDILENPDTVKKNKKKFMGELGIEIYKGKKYDEDTDDSDEDDEVVVKKKKKKKKKLFSSSSKNTEVSFSTLKKNKKKKIVEDEEDDD
jgi:hypothetical protein